MSSDKLIGEVHWCTNNYEISYVEQQRQTKQEKYDTMRTYPDKQTVLPIALTRKRRCADKTTETKLGEHDTRGEYDAVWTDHDDRSTFGDLVFWRQTPKDLSTPHLYIR
jgi:hypothetical protein